MSRNGMNIIHITDTEEVYSSVLAPKGRVFAGFRLSLVSQRLITAIASHVSFDDLSLIQDSVAKKEYALYKINITEFCEKYGYQTTDQYSKIKEALAELISTKFELADDKNKHYIQNGIIWKGEITEGIIKIIIDPELIPFYYEVGAIRYRLKNVASFSLPKTFRFYELFILKLGRKDRVEFDITVEELKRILALHGKFTAFNDFKKRVLLPVIEDINSLNEETNKPKCNILVKFIEVREKRKIIAVRFTVVLMRKEQVIETTATVSNDLDNQIYDSLTEDGKSAYDYFADEIKVSRVVLDQCIKDFTEDGFKKSYEYFLYMRNRKNLKSLAAYAAACLKNGWKLEKVDKQKVKVVDDVLPEKSRDVEEDLEQIENRKKLETLKSLDEEQQYKLFNFVLEKAKSDYKFSYIILKQNTYRTVLENPKSRSLYIHLLKKISRLPEEFDF